MGFHVLGLGFQVLGLGSRVSKLGFELWGLGSEVLGLGFEVPRLEEPLGPWGLGLEAWFLVAQKEGHQDSGSRL